MEKAVTMRLSSGGSSVDWAAEAETARQREERHWRLCRCRLCGKPIDGDDRDSGASTAASLCRRWCCSCGVARDAADALREEAPLQSAAAEKERALSIWERDKREEIKEEEKKK